MKPKKTKKQLKMANKENLLNLISEIIGVEPGDINDTDSLRDDLHMGPSVLAELSEKLADEGFDVVDLSEIDTIEDLLQELGID